ncbi:MAG: ABATE domain-containing protein [Rhodospirillales bacterium]|nr:ABATE domain-containing protein [Rhodospirillales bacterium]
MTGRPAPVASSLPAARIELCLDFVNTRFWRGSDVPEETLGAPQDLIAWLRGTVHRRWRCARRFTGCSMRWRGGRRRPWRISPR